MTQQDQAADATWREILGPRFAPSLLLVCLAVWLHAADSLLVATMIPAIVADIGGANLISWTVALYEVGSIVAGACSGLLALRLGVTRPMTCAAALYAVGCVLSASAPEMWVMLVGRLLQGLGGGGLVALSFVAIGQLFPKRLTARAMAAVSTLWGTSAFFGPLIGGLFVEFATWRGGFWFFALQGLLLAAWVALRRQPAPGGTSTSAVTGRIPGLRLLFLSAGVVLIALAGTEVSPLRTAGLVLAGLLSLAFFLRLDARQGDNRLLPYQPIGWANPVGAALTMILCFCAATIAITVYGPLLIVLLYETSALVAGYVIACSSIGWTIVAVLVSGSDERNDGRAIAVGMLLLVFSILGFAYSVPQGPIWLIAGFAALEGAGFGLSWTFILRRVTALAAPGEAERVAGAMPTVQRLGYALGAAYVGIIANAAGLAQGASQAVAGRVGLVMFLACLPIALVGLVAMLRFVRAR